MTKPKRTFQKSLQGGEKSKEAAVIPLKNRFADIVRLHRMAFHETQLEYAQRFGYESATAVSLWESGQRRVPNNVLEEIFVNGLPEYSICPGCNGAGVVKV
jgi:predicted transcriptional regulator